MNSDIPAWQRALLPQFLDLTASRQIEIAIERGTLEAGGDPAACSLEISKIAHKISGTAGTLGFSDLGQKAQRTEAICSKIAALPGHAAADAVRDQLLPALDALDGALTDALATTF